LDRNLAEIRQMSNYHKLIDAVAKYYTVIELCEDLTSRLESYGVCEPVNLQAKKKDWEYNKSKYSNKSAYEKAWDNLYAMTDAALGGVNSMMKQA